MSTCQGWSSARSALIYSPRRPAAEVGGERPGQVGGREGNRCDGRASGPCRGDSEEETHRCGDAWPASVGPSCGHAWVSWCHEVSVSAGRGREIASTTIMCPP